MPEGASGLNHIHYRLGLLLARDSKQHRATEQNLAKLTDPSRQADLKGMIALYADNPDEALRLFSQALDATSDGDQQARIYYHASLAHAKRGDLVESNNALFHAINNARSLALKQHIKIFFEQTR